jgi:hypothetical protein
MSNTNMTKHGHIIKLIDNGDSTFSEAVNVTNGGSESSVSQTRPADTTAYAIGDVVGSSNTGAPTVLTFTNVSVVAGSNVIITGLSLEVDVNAVPSGMGTFRLHLYDTSPTAIADNVAYNLPSADRAKYLGWLDIDTPVDLGDTLFVRMNNVNFKTKLATSSTSLYGILETRGAYTPSSGAVKVIRLNVLGV